MNFVKNFLFGSATSAYQTEGNISGQRNTDWDKYIKEHPEKETLKPDDIGPNWWSKGKAEKDFETLHQLGFNALRFGIEWARIEPERGEIEQGALQRYREMVEKLKSLGTKPMITLNHFTLPYWVTKQGGWENIQTIEDFKQFVALMVDAFPEVPYWITINEPSLIVSMGYLGGGWPPGKFSLKSAITVSKNLVKAHQESYELIKKRIPKAQVGVAHALMWFKPHNPNSLLDKITTKFYNALGNLSISKMAKDSDFIGINFYQGFYLQFSPTTFRVTVLKDNNLGIIQTFPLAKTIRPNTYLSDMGWAMVPEFLLEALLQIFKKYQKPMIITENGVADRADRYKAFYILTHLVAVHEAIKKGADIQGYFYWSSVDDQGLFWGFEYPLGLIAVDPKTSKRTIRKSTFLYSTIAKTHRIDIENLIKEYLPKDQQEKARKIISHLQSI